MTWTIAWLKQPYVPNLPFAETWTVDGEEFREPGDAITAVTFRLGIVTLGHQVVEGIWRVTDADGNVIACVRETRDNGRVNPEALRRWHGHTWVGWLNLLLFRWLLFRLYYFVEDDGSISHWGVKFAPAFWRW